MRFKTPYFTLHNTKPDITNIKVFGSIVYYKDKATGLKKLNPRAKKAILVGFGNNLYRLYNINSKRLIWAKDIKILKNQFYNFNSSKEANLHVNKKSVFNLNQKTDNQIVKQNQIIKQNQSVGQNQITRNQYSELDDDDINELALLGTNQN